MRSRQKNAGCLVNPVLCLANYPTSWWFLDFVFISMNDYPISPALGYFWDGSTSPCETSRTQGGTFACGNQSWSCQVGLADVAEASIESISVPITLWLHAGFQDFPGVARLSGRGIQDATTSKMVHPTLQIACKKKLIDGLLTLSLQIVHL